MRAVLDTNVLISAVVFGGLPGELVEAAREQRFQPILSPEILDELRRVLRKKFLYSDKAVYRAETVLRRTSIVVEPEQRVAMIQNDPADNRVLEAAIAGNADLIVSGDRAHLLPLHSFRGIPIVTPRQFLERIGKA